MNDFFNFAVFCGLKNSDGLFHEAFIVMWIQAPIYGTMDDDQAMFCMGGEL